LFADRSFHAFRHFSPIIRKSRPQLLTERVLSPKPTSGDRSIDTHINSLRRKLGERERAGVEISNIRGAGYVLTRSTRPW
jgi:DNA-binding response OmpR family regulator